MTFEGRAWRLGDDVNTDLIIPGKYLDNYDPKHLAAHALEGARKEFSSKVARGDLVVAGKNFGCGSSREQAVTALKYSGVSAVVAKSFARIFYRNSINLGLPAIISKDASDVLQDGEVAVLDLQAWTLTSADGTKTASLEPIPEHLQSVVNVGGLVPYLKLQLSGSVKNP